MRGWMWGLGLGAVLLAGVLACGKGQEALAGGADTSPSPRVASSNNDAEILVGAPLADPALYPWLAPCGLLKGEKQHDLVVRKCRLLHASDKGAFPRKLSPDDAQRLAEILEEMQSAMILALRVPMSQDTVGHWNAKDDDCKRITGGLTCPQVYGD